MPTLDTDLARWREHLTPAPDPLDPLAVEFASAQSVCAGPIVQPAPG